MATINFSKLFVCNFNDLSKVDGLTEACLLRVWQCDWTKEHLNEIIAKYQLIDGSNVSDDEAKEWLCHVIALTLIFVQNNFTGPFTQLEEFSEQLQQAKLLDCDGFVNLMENGEEINPNVKLGELLVMAKQLLNKLLAQMPDDIILRWWQLRLICVHQQIIDELTSNLYEQLKSTCDFLLEHSATLCDRELEGLLYLEVANAYLLYHRTAKTENILDDLCKRLNVFLNIQGLLGVRTKFQQKPLPQLCLKVDRNDEQSLPCANTTNGSHSMPKLLLLEDDTRLERIRFVEPADNAVMSLPSVLQALVLSKVRLLKRAQPKDRLADEELEPYTNTLLYQEHGPLQVRQSILLFNCVQEANQRRTVERSWKQCEEAVKLLNDTRYSLQQRLSYGFAGFLQPKWHVQMQLCEILLSLGMTKTALDIYLQIHAWEQVIHCYTRLELRHKAAAIIRQQLAKRPTVLLHCLLGDAIDDPKCYEMAWEFSKQTSGKAQAHWGNYYFAKQEYAKAVPHYEKSVEINSLQEKIWLRLGFAAIMLERWELAVHAYITYTHLEPLGFESWNNLAKALIKLGDKKRAHKVLGESLKCNYNNWKVWENFMVVAVDTGHFEDAINAYNRLSDLKERYMDLEVLCVIVHAIAEGKPDAKGQTPERLLKKATTLMGGQCVKNASEPKVWELAAVLTPRPLVKAQKLVKALNAYTRNEALWTTKQPYALKALQLAHSVCENALAAIDDHAADESEVMITSQLNSARLAAQATVRAVEKETLKFDDNESELKSVKCLLERISEQIQKRMKKC